MLTSDKKTLSRITIVKITVYQKPTCTTCRQVYAALRDAGVDFDAVDYYTDPIRRRSCGNCSARWASLAREAVADQRRRLQKLRLGERRLTDAEIIDLMVQHPDLIRGRSSRKARGRFWRAPRNACAKSCEVNSSGTDKLFR